MRSDEAAKSRAGAAVRLTRVLLRLYPRSFRREVGAPLVADVGRRAAEVAGDGSRARFARWFLRLAASLLANAASAWLEELDTRRRRVRLRRRRRRGADGESRRRHRGGMDRRASVLSWLDFKLGLRMLIRSPGLTLAGGLGIAVAIGVCAGFFAFFYAWAYPSLPSMKVIDSWGYRTGTRSATPRSGARFTTS